MNDEITVTEQLQSLAGRIEQHNDIHAVAQAVRIIAKELEQLRAAVPASVGAEQ